MSLGPSFAVLLTPSGIRVFHALRVTFLVAGVMVMGHVLEQVVVFATMDILESYATSVLLKLIFSPTTTLQYRACDVIYRALVVVPVHTLKTVLRVLLDGPKWTLVINEDVLI